MDLIINGLKKLRVTITNELQQYQLGKGSNNKKIQSYFINSLLLQLKTVDKTEHFINEISQSAETAPKQVIYKIINFYREINNQQSKNNENLDELKRFTEKVYESKTASLDKANELTEQIIEAYSGNYTKDFLNAIIEIVILILNDYIVMRKMYCRYVCSKFQVKEGEKMRDIQNDLFDVKETYCESCKYNIPGKTWCSKYKRIKPVSVMIGMTKCEKYCMLNNVIMGSIVGFAVGDALGVPVEFASREELSKNPVKGMIGNGTHNQKPGTWSDDTSLTIALIKALRDKEFNVDSIARRMMDWLYKGKYTANGKVFDVGNTTREAIWRMHDGVSPIEAGGKDEYSNGNGSLMRIHPLAFYLLNVDDFEEKKNIIYQVSSLTHANIISKVACHFLVELIICLLKTNNIRTAYDAVCREFAEYYTEDKIQSAFANIFSGKILSMPASSIKSSGYVIDTLETVLWCVFHTTTYKDAVLTAVNLGDDTDTVGAITGGIAGIMYGLDAIPEEWISKLANKMMVFNAASDLYKRCNKDNVIDNLNFSV